MKFTRKQQLRKKLKRRTLKGGLWKGNHKAFKEIINKRNPTEIGNITFISQIEKCDTGFPLECSEYRRWLYHWKDYNKDEDLIFWVGRANSSLVVQPPKDGNKLVDELNSGEKFIFKSAILYDKNSKYKHRERSSSNHEFILYGTGKLQNTSGPISRFAKHFGSTAPLHFFIKFSKDFQKDENIISENKGNLMYLLDERKKQTDLRPAPHVRELFADEGAMPLSDDVLGSARHVMALNVSLVEAVKKNGLALRDASVKLKGDREIVMAAIKQNGLALEFA